MPCWILADHQVTVQKYFLNRKRFQSQRVSKNAFYCNTSAVFSNAESRKERKSMKKYKTQGPLRIDCVAWRQSMIDLLHHSQDAGEVSRGICHMDDDAKRFGAIVRIFAEIKGREEGVGEEMWVAAGRTTAPSGKAGVTSNVCVFQHLMATPCRALSECIMSHRKRYIFLIYLYCRARREVSIRI